MSRLFIPLLCVAMVAASGARGWFIMVVDECACTVKDTKQIDHFAGDQQVESNSSSSLSIDYMAILQYRGIDSQPAVNLLLSRRHFRGTSSSLLNVILDGMTNLLAPLFDIKVYQYLMFTGQ